MANELLNCTLPLHAEGPVRLEIKWDFLRTISPIIAVFSYPRLTIHKLTATLRNNNLPLTGREDNFSSKSNADTMTFLAVNQTSILLGLFFFLELSLSPVFFLLSLNRQGFIFLLESFSSTSFISAYCCWSTKVYPQSPSELSCWWPFCSCRSQTPEGTAGSGSTSAPWSSWVPFS